MTIDLRSDTVTRPTGAMREAMRLAPVGDDVWGDDPSVIAFEHTIAAQADYPSALFFPSATQSNLAALLAHCQRGDEYIAGQQSHIYKYEGGGGAVLGGIQPQPIDHDADGTLAPEKIAAAIKVDDFHFARSRLLALENTFGGKVIPEDYLQRITAFAHSRGLATHLDGARLFNASIATGLPLKVLCAGFDSTTLCFSKGLGAPVGAVLLGSVKFIGEARRWRKVLGGGMRQSGILAAGCQHALDHHVARLAEDHDHARQLAQGLGAIEGLEVLSVATNMVFLAVPESLREPLQAYLAEHGVLMECAARTRLVTHLDVSAADIRKVIDRVTAFFRSVQR